VWHIFLNLAESRHVLLTHSSQLVDGLEPVHEVVGAWSMQ
jgi:hypothetical protein